MENDIGKILITETEIKQKICELAKKSCRRLRA